MPSDKKMLTIAGQEIEITADDAFRSSMKAHETDVPVGEAAVLPAEAKGEEDTAQGTDVTFEGRSFKLPEQAPELQAYAQQRQHERNQEFTQGTQRNEAILSKLVEAVAQMNQKPAHTPEEKRLELKRLTGDIFDNPKDAADTVNSLVEAVEEMANRKPSPGMDEQKIAEIIRRELGANTQEMQRQQMIADMRTVLPGKTDAELQEILTAPLRDPQAYLKLIKTAFAPVPAEGDKPKSPAAPAVSPKLPGSKTATRTRTVPGQKLSQLKPHEINSLDPMTVFTLALQEATAESE